MAFRLKYTLLPTLGLLLASCGYSPTVSVPSSSGRHYCGHRPGPKGLKTVVTDPGHGGKDSGAVSRHTGQKEKDLTLDMAKRIKGELGGYKVILMRNSDTFIDLDDR